MVAHKHFISLPVPQYDRTVLECTLFSLSYFFEDCFLFLCNMSTELFKV